jgi:hypothetical protein
MNNFILDTNAAKLIAAIQAIKLPANNNGYRSIWTVACAIATLNQAG